MSDIIANERQFKLTKKAIEELTQSLDELSELNLLEAGIDPVLIRAQRSSISGAISDLTSRVREYELAKSGAAEAFLLEGFEEIGEKLIAARISNAWTQSDLASRLSLKEQQIQRYERERYRAASLDRLIEVARVLGVTLVGRLQPRPTEAKIKDISDFLGSVETSCFPVREMIRREWLTFETSPRNTSDDMKMGAIRKFFLHSGIRHVSPMLHKRTYKPQTDITRCALLAWQARVRLVARECHHVTSFSSVSPQLVQTLARLTASQRGPIEAVEVLRQHGVVLTFVAHLPNTLLDGAAMLLEDGTPVIGMTLRQDRIDNFWHTLFHELGHIARHRNCGLAEGFLDEEEELPADPREAEADEFARNALIPDAVWKTSFVRYAKTKDQIVAYARGLGIGPEIVAGRLRFERSDFTKLGDMVGSRKVRVMMRDAGLFEE